MLFAQIMKHSLFGTLQHRIERFGGIVVRVATGILSFPMMNPIVSRIQLSNCLIRVKLIGHQVSALIDKIDDRWHQINQLVAFNRYGPNRAIALYGYQDSLFLGSSTSFVFDAVLEAWLSANVFFIQFNNTAERWNQFRSRFHHLADAMTHLPGTFLGNADPLGQDYGGHTFARMGHIVHG